MDRLPDWENLLIAYGVVNIVFQLIYLLNQWTKRNGPLFTQPASAAGRIIALFLGLLFGGLVIFNVIAGHAFNEMTGFFAIAAFGLIAYSAGHQRTLAEIQSGYAQNYHPARPAKLKKIVGADGLSLDEIRLLLQSGAKFVTYDYCISPLFVTLSYESDVYLVDEENGHWKWIPRFLLISLLFGWFSLFGPINTIRCLVSTACGGKDVTPEIVEQLDLYAARGAFS